MTSVYALVPHGVVRVFPAVSMALLLGYTVPESVPELVPETVPEQHVRTPAGRTLSLGSLLAAPVDAFLAPVDTRVRPGPASPLNGTLVSYPARLAKVSIMASIARSGLYLRAYCQ